MNTLRLLFPVILMAASGSVLAQPATPAASRMVMTMTRPVHIFSQREVELADALNKSDHAATNHLLAQDFEQRDGAAPAQPVPREQWLKLHHDFAADQMAVHDYGDVAVVSFVNMHAGAKSKDSAFVVDVWQKQGEDWRLAVRYQSLLGASKPPAGDIKPSGKN